ncbi:MAG: hypothetical protein U0R49_00160 [Fimbriimonadales bacterium]
MIRTRGSAPRIRNVLLAEAAPIVIGTEFESVVHIWDYDRGMQVASFQTIFDPGGRRVAVSPDSAIVFAAAYGRGGVAAYCAKTGELIWQRKDIRKVQRLVAFEQFLGVSLEGLSSLILRASDGSTETRVVRTNEVWGFSGSGFVVGASSREIFIYAWPSLDRLARIPMTSAGVLDVGISNSEIIVSEMNFKVRAFDRKTFEKMWEYDEPNERNITTLFPVGGSDVCYAVAFRTKEPYRSLVGRFDCKTGEFAKILEPVRLFAAVNTAGDRLIMTEGEVYSLTANGEAELTHKLDWN